MSEKTRVLVLCTGNSARSQMAEGSHDDRLETFRRVRDLMRGRFSDFVRDPRGTVDADTAS